MYNAKRSNTKPRKHWINSKRNGDVKRARNFDAGIFKGFRLKWISFSNKYAIMAETSLFYLKLRRKYTRRKYRLSYNLQVDYRVYNVIRSRSIDDQQNRFLAVEMDYRRRAARTSRTRGLDWEQAMSEARGRKGRRRTIEGSSS